MNNVFQVLASISRLYKRLIRDISYDSKLRDDKECMEYNTLETEYRSFKV